MMTSYYRLRWMRRVLIIIFLFSTVMILVNSAAFFGDTSVSSSISPVDSSQVDESAAAQPNSPDITRDTKTTTTTTNPFVGEKLQPQQLKFSQAKRFIRRPWSGKPDCSNFTVRRTLKNSLPPVALASFPGSGNTWVRHLIETASGIYTGSVYKDANLYLLGFWGELAEWDAGVTCVQKSHDSDSNHIKSFSGGRAIFLNRNPYEAVLSFHNFLYGGHTGHAPSSNFRRPEWGDFFLDQTRHWLATAVNWTFHSSELLTVHYEELKEDPLPQLRRILNFLKLPIDERRLACVQKYPQKKFHRQKSRITDWDEKVVFPQRIRLPLDRAIRYVDYLSRTRGNRPAPLDRYNYYNNSGRHRELNLASESKKEPNQKDEPVWYERLRDELGERAVLTLWQDPLTKILTEEALSDNSFYTWKIPFDTNYDESPQLESHFNSGPPEFIRQIRRLGRRRPNQTA